MGIPNNIIIQNALEDTKTIFESDEYERVLVWLTGKPESTILFHICNKLDVYGKCDFIFFYTDVTLGADMEHMEYLSDKYDRFINIVDINGVVKDTCNKYGLPFLSVVVSYNLARLQEMNFKWEDKPFEELCKEYLEVVDKPSNRNTLELNGKYYKGSYGALRWWCNQYDSKAYNINRYGYLKEFIMENPPTFKISDKCCKEVIKKPLHKYATKNKFDIVLSDTIEIKGSIKSKRSNKFIKANYINRNYDQYLPLYEFSQTDVMVYKRFYDLKLSDSFEVYHNSGGICVGCPYGGLDGINEDMRMAERYAQGSAMRARKVFGDSYEYTEAYTEYAKYYGKRFNNKRGRKIFV